MFKNVASQRLTVFAFDATTNLPKTGDAANLTAYVSKDDAAVTVLTDTSATEADATNAKGYYLFDLAQAETNADKLAFSCKSATANIVVIACPPVVYTLPANFTALSVSASTGLVSVPTTQKVDVETIKTQTVTCSAGVTVSPFVGSTGAAVNGTNANTLSSHDPGATLGTSTLNAAGVRTAVGLATANLDTQLAALTPGSPIDQTVEITETEVEDS